MAGGVVVVGDDPVRGILQVPPADPAAEAAVAGVALKVDVAEGAVAVLLDDGDGSGTGPVAEQVVKVAGAVVVVGDDPVRGVPQVPPADPAAAGVTLKVDVAEGAVAVLLDDGDGSGPGR